MSTTAATFACVHLMPSLVRDKGAFVVEHRCRLMVQSPSLREVLAQEHQRLGFRVESENLRCPFVALKDFRRCLRFSAP
jgi:hypothetical protein